MAHTSTALKELVPTEFTVADLRVSEVAVTLLAASQRNGCPEDLALALSKKVFLFEKVTPENILPQLAKLSLINETIEVAIELNNQSQTRKKPAIHRIRAELYELKVDINENFKEQCRRSEFPTEILKALHHSALPYVNASHLSALLSIKDERISGELDRHRPDEQDLFSKRGGWRYQASDFRYAKEVFQAIRLAPGTTFCDVGSGYGHVIFYGASVCPHARYLGIELMSARVEECRRVAQLHRFEQTSFRAQDACECDFADADILYFFNPFPEEITPLVALAIEQRASKKPLVVIDYAGTICEGIENLIPTDILGDSDLILYVSAEHQAASLDLVGYHACPSPSA